MVEHTPEREFAIVLANKILDRVNADPDDDLAVLARQLLRRTENIAALKAVIAEQAADGGLWFIPHTAAEAYLMQELRKLHAAFEGVSPDDCARAALGTAS